jgi:hypothetical protein
MRGREMDQSFLSFAIVDPIVTDLCNSGQHGASDRRRWIGSHSGAVGGVGRGLRATLPATGLRTLALCNSAVVLLLLLLLLLPVLLLTPSPPSMSSVRTVSLRKSIFRPVPLDVPARVVADPRM